MSSAVRPIASERVELAEPLDRQAPRKRAEPRSSEGHRLGNGSGFGRGDLAATSLLDFRGAPGGQDGAERWAEGDAVTRAQAEYALRAPGRGRRLDDVGDH